jgi:hypothetical protein
MSPTANFWNDALNLSGTILFVSPFIFFIVILFPGVNLSEWYVKSEKLYYKIFIFNEFSVPVTAITHLKTSLERPDRDEPFNSQFRLPIPYVAVYFKNKDGRKSVRYAYTHRPDDLKRELTHLVSFPSS